MTDQSDRCPAVHPELGLRCERTAEDCDSGINHTAKREDGTDVVWPNRHGTTPVDEFFADWRNQLCPICETPLDLQFKSPVLWLCAMCRKWFNEKLERM